MKLPNFLLTLKYFNYLKSKWPTKTIDETKSSPLEKFVPETEEDINNNSLQKRPRAFENNSGSENIDQKK
jgi:hypothetical protein